MATIKAFTLSIAQYSGDTGNSSAGWGEYNGTASVGDEIQLLKVPGGTEIFDLTMVNAALGASSTLSVGFRYEDGTTPAGEPTPGDTALIAATSTAAAARTNYTGFPVLFKRNAIIYVKVAGAGISGRVNVRPEYVFKGTL